MKNKEYFKKYLFKYILIVLVFLMIFIVINIVEYNKYISNFNYKTNAILSLVKEKYSDITDEELLEILNSSLEDREVLSKYGYDINKDSYISNISLYYKIFSILKLIVLLGLFVIVIYLFIKYSYLNDREIDKIIKCIENINNKNYDLDIYELSEDKLSILKQEIYKTTVMLKENAENSLKDKINIKNSIQDISHQLKTPLTSINILLDNIIDDQEMDGNTRREFIKQIKREITNINFLVQSILKLSKFETNMIDFNRENVSVKKIIDGIIKNVSNLCDLKDIKIEVSNKCKKKINCDYKWQIEALTNILKNAVEYSYNGGRVFIIGNEFNLYTEIIIKDMGRGMDEEDRLNIFKRFYKGKSSNSDSIGIGLSLAKMIIEKDNGVVLVDSVKDMGTVFRIRYYY